MRIDVDGIPAATRWAMASRGLTGSLIAHLQALYQAVGTAAYGKIIREIWTGIGQGSAAGVQAMGMKLDNARAVAEAAAAMCICTMGPEYRIEAAEASADRTVMRITACPFNNRMRELGISHDLLSACDAAFWRVFVKALNPRVAMRHGKQMHRGDAYCEWIFEAKG